MDTSNLKIGELLLFSGKINEKQLESVILEQKNSPKRLGEILLDKGLINSSDIVEVLEQQLGFPKVDLSRYSVNLNTVNIIPETIARKYKVLPIDEKNGKLVLAMVDPLNFFAIDDVKLYTKMDLQPVIASKEEILQLIDKYFSGESTKKVLEEFTEDNYHIYGEDEDEVELAQVTTAPIVRLLNSIIEQAVRSRASDIHIEPSLEGVRVRIRVDGDLQEVMNLNRNNLSPLITRIKIIGKMNIAEKRIPQDGRVESVIGNKEIDMRISTLPTVYGEKAVIRLLDKSQFEFSRKTLGFSQENLELFNNILAHPHGMILVTGPTGSGKTTTLYTALRELNTTKNNIITIEDPVEYKLNGINQVQVNNKAGLNFASGLRSMLRQDPDIIMVGEIRDSETAEIAIRAAITGHLVLSTLHTNDSPSTIARLVDMGVEPYLVSSAMVGVISQRLVKKLCTSCKEKYEASYSEKKMLNIGEDEKLYLHKPVGCNACNQGYHGRTAIHEIMYVDEGLRRLIDSGANIDDIRNYSMAKGMVTISYRSIDLAIQGVISFEEAMRVGFTLA